MENLNFEVENLESVPENIRPLYVEATKKTVDDKDVKVFRLAVAGVKPIDEFNTVYETLVKERNSREDFEKKLKKYGDKTPEMIEALTAENSKLKVAASSSSQEEFIKRIEEVKTENQRAFKEFSDKANSEKAQLQKELSDRDSIITNMKLEQELRSEYDKLGGVPNSFYLVMNEAKNQFEFNSTVKSFRTKDGVLTVNEWLQNDFFKRNGNFLKGNVSANASENGGKTDGYEKYFNPNGKDYNMTKQAELYKKNPDLALSYMNKYNK